MKRLLILTLTLMILFSACGKQEAAESPSPLPETPAPETPSPEPTPEPTPEPIYDGRRNPLNGSPMDDDAPFKRLFAVQINNAPVAQPQCSISKADIIIEALAEGDITRMLALFTDISEVETFGSIRSSREYFVDIVQGYDAIYVHAGGSPQAYSAISSRGINNMDGVNGKFGGSIFYRDQNRMTGGLEHSMFTTPERVLEYAPKLDYIEEYDSEKTYGLSFSELAEIEGGDAAKEISVSFSKKTSKFFFDEEKAAYSMQQHGGDYIDGDNDEKCYFENVLVLQTDVKIIDNEGRRDIVTVGNDSGYYFSGGKYCKIEWNRNSNDEPFTFTLEDGSTLNLSVGKTYICLVSSLDSAGIS
ncbi:DUF3048 domain-containing protein [Clostridiaceae bacterium OttesenSCG-928-D20]|nr:DUF3048 domain-containing protein [Clostridiaceae bacterium OttesenSCG-928-D20]